MRYIASEKMEIIRLVEQSNLPVRQTLKRLDIGKSTFYHWLKRLESGGIDALEDNNSSPGIPWNRLPEAEQTEIIDLALEKPDLSPRELAVTYTDQQARFVSESTVYRLLKAHDLITSPAYILIQAADKFSHPTTRVNEMWHLCPLGRLTSPTARSSVGGGITCQRYWMTSPGLSSPGACVPPWLPKTSQTPWMMPCALPDSTRSR